MPASAAAPSAGKRVRLGDHKILGRTHLLRAALSTRHIKSVAAASVLALALGPATALAAPSSRSHADPTTQVKQGSPLANDNVPRGTALGEKVLAFGSGYDSLRGSALVRALQRRLAQAGDEPGPVDGRYGPLTEHAVERFQADHGLQLDGIAGPRTLATLSSPTMVLYPGAGSGEPEGSGLVRQLQGPLWRAGDKPGPIDGRYGPLTEQAVRRFQAAHGLHVDGIATRQTFVELRNPAHPHRPASPPPAGYQRPTRVPAATMLRHSHPTGWPSAGWLAFLIAVGLLVPLAVALYVRRRSDRRLTAVPESGNTQSQTGGIAREAGLVAPAGVSKGLTGAEPASSHSDAERDASGEFNLGALLEGRGHLAGAEEAYRRADQLGHAAGACKLGVLLEGQGELAGAEAAYRRADERGHAAGARNLGVLLEKQGDLAGATAAYRRADERDDASGAFKLGLLLAEQGDRAGAVAALRRADKRGHPAAAAELDAWLEDQGDYDAVSAAHLLDERGDATGAAKLGDALVNQSELDGAIAALKEADEHDPAAALKLGVLLEEGGDLEGACAAYGRADRCGDANGAFNLGCLLAEQGDFAGAIAAFRRADERGDPAAASNLGTLLQREGDLDDAAAAYRRADDRGDGSGAFNLGLLLASQGDLSGAREAYERARDRGDPTIAEHASAALADLGATVSGPNLENGGGSRCSVARA